MKLALVAAVIALAGCEKAGPTKRKDAGPPPPVDAAPEQIDVVITIDGSKSMEETDVPRDRFDGAQRAARRFVAKMGPRDRTAIVLFGQVPRVMQAFTTDRDQLDTTLERMQLGDVPALGTAMGDALGLAVEQFAGSTAKRKAIILIADGDTNWVTKYDNDQGAALARAQGIPVHSIFVGKPDNDQLFGGMSANPEPLKKIATATGGTFAHATDDVSFDRAFDGLLSRP